MSVPFYDESKSDGQTANEWNLDSGAEMFASSGLIGVELLISGYCR